jgi:hypothetical protein
MRLVFFALLWCLSPACIGGGSDFDCYDEARFFEPDDGRWQALTCDSGAQISLHDAVGGVVVLCQCHPPDPLKDEEVESCVELGGSGSSGLSAVPDVE